jgi:hypothetical protein
MNAPSLTPSQSAGWLRTSLLLTAIVLCLAVSAALYLYLPSQSDPVTLSDEPPVITAPAHPRPSPATTAAVPTPPVASIPKREVPIDVVPVPIETRPPTPAHRELGDVVRMQRNP